MKESIYGSTCQERDDFHIFPLRAHAMWPHSSFKAVFKAVKFFYFLNAEIAYVTHIICHILYVALGLKL